MTCSEIAVGVFGLATLAGTGYFIYKAVEPTKPGQYALVQQVSSDMQDQYKSPGSFSLYQKKTDLDTFVNRLTEAGVQAPAAKDKLAEIIGDLTIIRNDYPLLQDQDLYAAAMEHVHSETDAIIPKVDKSDNWAYALLTFFGGTIVTVVIAGEIDDWS